MRAPSSSTAGSPGPRGPPRYEPDCGVSFVNGRARNLPCVAPRRAPGHRAAGLCRPRKPSPASASGLGRAQTRHRSKPMRRPEILAADLSSSCCSISRSGALFPRSLRLLFPFFLLSFSFFSLDPPPGRAAFGSRSQGRLLREFWGSDRPIAGRIHGLRGRHAWARSVPGCRPRPSLGRMVVACPSEREGEGPAAAGPTSQPNMFSACVRTRASAAERPIDRKPTGSTIFYSDRENPLSPALIEERRRDAKRWGRMMLSLFSAFTLPHERPCSPAHPVLRGRGGGAPPATREM